MEMRIKKVLHGFGMGHVAAITVRYLVYGLQGGSLKCNGVLVEGLTRQANISFTLTGLILSLQQSLAYLAGEFSFYSILAIVSFYEVVEGVAGEGVDRKLGYEA